MPSPEVPLQRDMFTDELVDTRTQRQKQSGRKRKRSQQAEMFSMREIAQFGVKAKPLLPLAPQTNLVLVSEDPRTPEEKERDRQRAAEEKTHAMFDESGVEGGASEITPSA